jgi:hypothetical protein
MIARILNFGIVMGTVYFAGPLAFRTDEPLIQAAAITLLAFVWRTLLSPEPPEVYLVNGKETEEGSND